MSWELLYILGSKWGNETGERVGMEESGGWKRREDTRHPVARARMAGDRKKCKNKQGETGIVTIISIFHIQYVVAAVGRHGNYPEITCYSQLPGLESGSKALHHFSNQ